MSVEKKNEDFLVTASAALRTLPLPQQIRAIEQLGNIGTKIAMVPTRAVLEKMDELGIEDQSLSKKQSPT